MIVTISLIKRKKGLTREQFLHHYGKIHASLTVAKNIPGLRRYVQNHPVNGGGPEFDTDIDGISEIGFDDVASALSFYRWLESSPEAEDLRKDGESFIDSENRSPVFLAEEHILKESGLTDRGGTKVIKTIARLKIKKGLTREQFLNHYVKIHASMFLARTVPGLRKYVQYHSVKVEGSEFESGIGGISEMWFDDLASLKAFRQWLESSPEAEDLRKDGESFIDSENRSPVFLAEEHVIIE
jgi:uncharacterized protein (TIGR02118 family)